MSTQAYFISGDRQFYLKAGQVTGLFLNKINLVAPNVSGNQTINGNQIVTGNQSVYGNLNITNLNIENIDSFLLSGVDLEIKSGNLNSDGQILGRNLVYNTGNQIISGIKNFNTRPQVNTTGIMISGDVSKVEMAYFSWTPFTDQNLGILTDFFPPYNNQYYNTNFNTFELAWPTSTSPVSRVYVKESGYYNIKFQYYGYDLKTQNRITMKLWASTTSSGAFTLNRWLCKKRYPNLDSDGDTLEVSVDTLLAPNWYACSMLAEDVNPFTIRAISIANNIPTFSFQLTKLRGL